MIFKNENHLACEGCGLHLDPYGHHMMTCVKTSSYQAAHTQLAAAFAELQHRASAPYTDKNVPRHLTTEKVGDALIHLSGEAKQLVLDFSITHPVLGARSANGTLKWNNKLRYPDWESEDVSELGIRRPCSVPHDVLDGLHVSGLVFPKVSWY
jgi:hypothetical protein